MYDENEGRTCPRDGRNYGDVFAEVHVMILAMRSAVASCEGRYRM